MLTKFDSRHWGITALTCRIHNSWRHSGEVTQDEKRQSCCVVRANGSWNEVLAWLGRPESAKNGGSP